MRNLVKCLAAVFLLTTPGSAWGNGPDANAADRQSSRSNATPGWLLPVSFDSSFLDATNLASPGAGHMHGARYTLENPDRFTTVWDFVKDGKVAYSETQHFTRSR